MEPRKIVLAFDSFKGSLNSEQSARCASAAIARVFPDCQVVTTVVADGGEGTTEAILRALGGQHRTVRVHDPLMRPIEASYGTIDNGRTAILELAAAAGLTRLLPAERNPWITSTFGVGEMIAHALQEGCRRFLIGIGGSATNDAGCGLMRALGFRFLDADGRELDGTGASLERIAAIDDRNVLKELREADFTVACDVDNPLFGPQGAARIFARQKGADPQMIDRLDAGLRNFATIAERHTGIDFAQTPGAGAAGGVGGGMLALLGARLRPGIEMLLDAIGFDRLIAGADLILTGEGRIDHQTLHGKVPCGVLQAGQRLQIPVIALGGAVENPRELTDSGFAALFPIVAGPMTLEEAMCPDRAARNLENTVEQLMRILKYVARP